MPRPKTKKELLTLSDNRYRGLMGFIASLNEIDRRFGKNTRTLITQA